MTIARPWRAFWAKPSRAVAVRQRGAAPIRDEHVRREARGGAIGRRRARDDGRRHHHHSRLRRRSRNPGRRAAVVGQRRRGQWRSPSLLRSVPTARQRLTRPPPQLEGSGFGSKHKFVFATILCGFFSSAITTGALRDVYAIKFHIGIGTMSSIQAVHNAAAIFIDVAVGHMQDNEWWVFSYFNRSKWGRRAPWVILATPVMSLMNYFVSAQATPNRELLH